MKKVIFVLVLGLSLSLTGCSLFSSSGNDTPIVTNPLNSGDLSTLEPTPIDDSEDQVTPAENVLASPILEFTAEAPTPDGFVNITWRSKNTIRCVLGEKQVGLSGNSYVDVSGFGEKILTMTAVSSDGSSISKTIAVKLVGQISSPGSRQ